MREHLKFYIDGQWVDPVTPRTHDVIDPQTEEPTARISLGSAADVDKAVTAAAKAFETFQFSSREERLGYLAKILELYQARMGDIAEAISLEMGAPLWLARAAQAPSAMAHFMNTMQTLKDFHFEETKGSTLIRYEPVGVCGLITPWNWPINQIACKVAPAIAAGCTMVLKPSELAPINAMILAEIIHDSGLPKGVFNLVNGDGPGVGAAMSAHPGIDMMSFTGSTRAGVMVAKAAADTVKRVAQELGGKSANIVLEDADLEKAVKTGVLAMMNNTGQSCNAPSRMFVPRGKQEQAKAIARAAAETVKVQDPKTGEKGAMGPLSSQAQFNKVQGLIQKGHRGRRNPGCRRRRPAGRR
jgi:aldehyde dehydrogenase (NAD+)